MKASKNTGSARFVRTAVACAAFAMLAACGGGSSDNNSNASSTPAGGVKLQVVSFGDSLSDVGTYTPVISANFGGGRFTTNPGEIWTQKVAEYYGGTLTPAYLGGFGQPLKANGGFGYAQGGSDVVNPIGIGYAPNSQAATTIPVSAQVTQYLTDHGSFNSSQLVLINGGANDILQLLQNTTFMTNLETTLATTPAAQQPLVIGQAVGTQLQGAIAGFVTLVGTTLAKGATHVVVVDVPDIGLTPLAASAAASNNAPQLPTLITAMVTAYNTLVSTNLKAQGLDTKVIKISSFNWLHSLLGSYQAQGFTNSTGTACNLTQMATNATAYATANPAVLTGTGLTAQQYGAQFASSLFCSPQTLTVAGADQTYVFADTIHPTTHAHALFATYVQQQIAATGLGK